MDGFRKIVNWAVLVLACLVLYLVLTVQGAQCFLLLSEQKSFGLVNLVDGHDCLLVTAIDAGNCTG